MIPEHTRDELLAVLAELGRIHPQWRLGQTLANVAMAAGRLDAGAVWDFRGGLVYQRLFWDTAAGLDLQAGAARDRLFSSALAVPDGLPLLWREAGLGAIERGSITMRMEYADFADYWEPLLGGQGPVGAYVAGLSPEQRQLIRGRVRLSYLSGAPDGPRSMTATAWAVRGTVP